jgi:DNA polymerase-1
LKRIVIDIEADGLEPTKIWLIVCKDIDDNKYHIFRKVSDDEGERRRFEEFTRGDILWIGHNWLGFDWLAINKLLPHGIRDISTHSCDTLIISKMVDYSRKSHSIEDYGLEFNLPKGDFSDWSKYSKEMEEYCIRDVDITEKIYRKYIRFINKPEHRRSILTEHKFQLIVNELHENGFAFNVDKAKKLLDKVERELAEIDVKFETAFPPREVLIREFIPKATKFGTISKTSVPRSLHDNIHQYEIGKTYRHTKLVPFNPSSHKQLIDVLWEAGWKPEDKTKTYLDTEREYNLIKYSNKKPLDLGNNSDIVLKLERLKRYGYKINEHNLGTLPPSAPSPARLLAKRILLEARRRTLTEWLGLVRKDGRIHGRFYSIGAWTHRMAHQEPNTANIPNEFDTQGKKKLYGKEMRSLWQAPKNRLLVGVDAEGIQLRIFAHYINDPEFTKSLVEGKKDDKTDPHSLNQSILGTVCKSRAAAKRYIYALLLGAGQGKLAEILDTSGEAATEAYERLLRRYTGFAELKETIIPADAKRGWFIGIDGRPVRIPGDQLGMRRHLAMSGYLQCGEAVVMKEATLKWASRLKDYDAKLVNFVHDEWQVEIPNDFQIGLSVAKMMADSLRIVGEELGLKCPLAGSYWNDDVKDYTIANNWALTH